MARGRGPRVRYRWRRKGFEEIRRSPGVKNRLGEEVYRVVSEVGADGYDYGISEGKSRSRGYVLTTSYATMKDNARNYTILRALERGRQ